MFSDFCFHEVPVLGLSTSKYSQFRFRPFRRIRQPRHLDLHGPPARSKNAVESFWSATNRVFQACMAPYQLSKCEHCLASSQCQPFLPFLGDSRLMEHDKCMIPPSARPKDRLSTKSALARFSAFFRGTGQFHPWIYHTSELARHQRATARV